MHRTRVYKFTHPQLAYSAQSLKIWMLDNIKNCGRWNRQKPIKRVIYYLVFVKHVGGANIRRICFGAGPAWLALYSRFSRARLSPSGYTLVVHTVLLCIPNTQWVPFLHPQCARSTTHNTVRSYRCYPSQSLGLSQFVVFIMCQGARQKTEQNTNWQRLYQGK
jgi:hypothetical protein